MVGGSSSGFGNQIGQRVSQWATTGVMVDGAHPTRCSGDVLNHVFLKVLEQLIEKVLVVGYYLVRHRAYYEICASNSRNLCPRKPGLLCMGPHFKRLEVMRFWVELGLRDDFTEILRTSVLSFFLFSIISCILIDL